MKKVKVVFVCLGNICRSPTAHGVFRHLVEEAGLEDVIEIDSAGTASWHEGKAPDSRSQEAARARGIEIRDLKARQFVEEDFDEFDYVLAMDEENLANLEALRPANFSGHLGLFLEFSEQSQYREVPDPYYGGAAGFETVLDLVEDASLQLLSHLQQ